MDLGKGLGHLTYSTLVHPGDTWEDMWTSLTTYVPQVQKRVCPKDPFGVSLRLSNSSATTLVKSKPERDKLKKFLADNNMYLYTVNAFPYGPFKNTDRQGAGVRAGLAQRRAHAIHHQRRRDPRRRGAGKHPALDPERAARLQAATSPARPWSTATPSMSCGWRRISSSSRSAPAAP